MIVESDTIATYLGISSTALLITIHARIEVLIKEFCGCGLEQATYTDYYPASEEVFYDDLIHSDDTLYSTNFNRRRLFLKETPVRSIASVYENAYAYGVDANWTADHLLTEGTHFYLDRNRSGISKTGILTRINGNWPITGRSVKVTYSGGYSAAELLATDIPLAVMEATAAAWQQCGALQGPTFGEGFGPITTEGTGPQNTSFDPSSVREIAGMIRDLPIRVQKMLWKYKSLDVVPV